jgi:hypothetical protein
MKLVSTIFSVIIIIAGITFKIMRLQRITSGGDPVSSFEMGQEMGAAAARGSRSAPSGVQSNPFVD